MGVVNRHAMHRLGSVRRWVERKSELLLIVLVLMLPPDMRGRLEEIGKHILVLALVVLNYGLLRVRILHRRLRSREDAMSLGGRLAVFGWWI